MEIGPDDFTDLPHEVDAGERKVSVKKLIATFVVILGVGGILLPLFSFAFERGWLQELGFACVVVLCVALGLHERQKSNR
jgi:hypothetical protein